MKYLLALTIFLASNAYSDNMFLAIKMGYKFQESDKFVINGKSYDASFGHKMGSHVRLGYKWNTCMVSFVSCAVGISHDSQLLSGKPFNDDPEYSKSEWYVETEINLSDLF